MEDVEAFLSVINCIKETCKAERKKHVPVNQTHVMKTWLAINLIWKEKLYHYIDTIHT